MRVEVVELALRHKVHPVLYKALHVSVGREATHLEPRGGQCVGVTPDSKRETRTSWLAPDTTSDTFTVTQSPSDGRVDTIGHLPPRAMSAILRAPVAVALRGDRHGANGTRARASVSSDGARPEITVSRKTTRPIVWSASLAAVTGASPAFALEVWRYPDGSNPLEALFAGPSPFPFVTGELTGVWFGDLFAYMNLALLLVLLAASSKSLDETQEDE